MLTSKEVLLRWIYARAGVSSKASSKETSLLMSFLLRAKTITSIDRENWCRAVDEGRRDEGRREEEELAPLT